MKKSFFLLFIISFILNSCGPLLNKRSPDLSDRVVESGKIIPTIYYTPIIEDNFQACKSSDRKNIYLKKEKVLNLTAQVFSKAKQFSIENLKICPLHFSLCLEQGSCVFIQEGKSHHLNYQTTENQKIIFSENIKIQECAFGLGVRQICLKPFYSIAADLNYYHIGDIIFIPAVIGTILPDGSAHTGYFTVEDEGHGVKGLGRFDFFTGYLSWKNPNNPFLALHLGDQKTRLPYYKIQK